MRATFFSVSLLTIVFMGCNPPPPAPVVSNPPAAQPTPPNSGSAVASAMSAVQEAQKTSPGNTPAGSPAPAATPTPPSATIPANSEQVRAQAGVGLKGRSLDAHEGIVVTPVKQYFRAKELAAFNIQVPQALQFYKANDPQGQGPKTHEAYMEDVIRANNIKLPELPPGNRYLYDPQTEELTVIRPKAEAPPTGK